MAERKFKKILVALDGSDRSLLTVKYLTKLPAFRKHRIVLFHVFNAIPESYYDLEREPKSVKTVKYARAWESQQKKNMEAFMEKAREILLHNGFPAENLKVKIHSRKKGIARDIIREAHEGYDVVVTRRRGMGRIQGIILGSVSMKLLQGLTFIPLLLAGRKPPGPKMLIAMDGSPGAMKAVDFAGAFLEGSGCEFCLLGVIRGAEDRKEMEALSVSENQVQTAEKQIAGAFEESKQRLVASGIDPAAISTKIVTGARSRAETIVAEGRQGDFGTVIMGRRGLTRPRDFFLGRVTNKVIYLAREKSVWIING